MKAWAMVENTLRESLEKKVLVVYFVISTLAILFLLFGINFVEGAGKVKITVLGEQGELTGAFERLVVKVEAVLVRLFLPFVMLFSLSATCGLFPSMLSEGSVELILSKPLRRSTIVLSRFAGCVIMVFLNVAYLVLGFWLVLSLKTGVYNFGFLWSGLMMVFIFFVLMTVMALAGVVSRSASISLMSVFSVYILSSILAHHRKFLPLISEDFWRWLVKGAYYVLPKIDQLSSQTKSLVEGGVVDNWMPIWSSAAFGAAVLGTAIAIFERKDF